MSIKKLNLNLQPTEPMPEIYRQQDPIIQPTSNQQPVKPPQPQQVQEVPQKALYNYNLKKIKSFKQIRRKYKMSNQSQIFINDLSLILQEYLPENFQFDNELLIHILNIAESYFIYGNKQERNEQKVTAVRILMKPYFREDVHLLDVMISCVWCKVSKTNMFKRVYKRLQNSFFLK